MRIDTEVRSVQDLMRRDPGLDGDAQRLEQLVWLILLRVCSGRNTVLPVDELPQDLRWESWTRGLPNDPADIPAFVEDQVLGRLRRMHGGTKGELALLLGPISNRMTNGHLIRDLIGRIDGWPLSGAADVHHLGRMYEQLVSVIGGAGNAGEFYTPRPLTRLLAELVDLQPEDVVLDPASGTSGMLVSALGIAEDARMPIHVRGIEKKSLPRLLGATNLVLHGIPRLDAIRRGNLLAEPWDSTREICDVVLTNPPFGAIEEPGVELATPEGLRSPDTLDLFLARIPSMLKPGGRAAVVVPDGFLFGGGARRAIRERLAEDYKLELVLRLPKGVFSPYTGIASNVIFFRRAPAADSFWLYEVTLPSGVRTLTKSRPLTDRHLDGFRTWWKAPEEAEHSRLVKLADLSEHGFSFDLRPVRARATARHSGSLLDSADVARGVVTEAADHLVTVISGEAAEDRATVFRQLVERGSFDRPAVTPEGRTLRQTLLLAGVTGWLTKLDDTPAEDQPHPSPHEVRRGRTLPLDLTHLSMAPAAAGWTWAPLRSYGDLVGGGTPNTREEGCFSDHEGIPWLTPADLRGMSGKLVSRGRRFLTDFGLKSSSAKLLPPGSILFSTRAPIGYVAIAERDLATNQGFRSIVPRPGVDPSYVYYLLSALAPLIDNAASGTTFKEVSGGQLANLTVFVPPETHQAAIAARLDLISEALTAWEAAVAQLHAKETRALSGLLSGVDPAHGLY